MERVAGIEPASLAWKAKVLPLYHTRNDSILNRNKSVLGAMMSYDTFCKTINMVVGEGFEPSKLSRQIYSLLGLTAPQSHLDCLI